MSEIWAIVVAAGSGERFGEPKQFAMLAGARLVDRAVAAASSACEGVVLVLPPPCVWDGDPVSAVVGGGQTRSESVRAGLAAIPRSATIVVVHDAARPFAPPSLFRAVIDAVRAGADAAVPGVPITDTVKRVDGDRVIDTVRRDELVVVQTPQAFRADALREAHASAADATDDAALVEAAGGRAVVVPGDPRNLKITRPEDLVVAEAIATDPGGAARSTRRGRR
jgi:2-C-methyl-D-erythritol 4-phosphate cytidylyltransferase